MLDRAEDRIGDVSKGARAKGKITALQGDIREIDIGEGQYDIVLAAAVLLAASFTAGAQFPAKPIRIIVPYQAGGTSEVMARLVGEQLTAALKQPVVIENRPGGGTTIGAAATAQAPAPCFGMSSG